MEILLLYAFLTFAVSSLIIVFNNLTGMTNISCFGVCQMKSKINSFNDDAITIN